MVARQAANSDWGLLSPRRHRGGVDGDLHRRCWPVVTVACAVAPARCPVLCRYRREGIPERRRRPLERCGTVAACTVSCGSVDQLTLVDEHLSGAEPSCA